MNDIFVERYLPQPLTEADIRAMQMAVGGCLDIHRIDWRGSLVSSEGTEMFCHFRGPDAESVRIAMHRLGAPPPGKVWACRVQDAPGFEAADLARANVVIDHRFDEPADFGARQVLDDVDMGCFPVRRLRLVRSYLTMDGLRMMALYEAPDAEWVRLAQRRAGLPADRVWAVRRYAP